MKQRKSLSDTQIGLQVGHNFLGAMYGKTPMDVGVKQKRAHTKSADDSDLEAGVLREVTALLAVHPKVLFAVRQNSGMSYNEGGAPIYFYKWARSRVKMRVTDFWGMLTDGRMFALECKRRNWKSPSGTREGEQQAFLMVVLNHGGVSAFVTSAEQAQKIIEG